MSACPAARPSATAARHQPGLAFPISTITDGVLDEVKAWQTRPLDEVYPIVYVDCLMVKVRDGGHVRNKAAYLVVGVGLDGVRHVLGIWVQATEGAKFSSVGVHRATQPGCA